MFTLTPQIIDQIAAHNDFCHKGGEEPTNPWPGITETMEQHATKQGIKTGWSTLNEVAIEFLEGPMDIEYTSERYEMSIEMTKKLNQVWQQFVVIRQYYC